MVSAYEPVPEGRLRTERPAAQADVQWAVNPRDDVLALLQAAAGATRFLLGSVLTRSPTMPRAR